MSHDVVSKTNFEEPLPVEAPLKIDRVSISTNIVSTLLLRISSRLSFTLLSFYLGDALHSTFLVGFIIEAFYISELAVAPIAGSFSDRVGRKPLLIVAPLIGALAAALLLVSAVVFPEPNPAVITTTTVVLLIFIMIARLLEGATTAINTPACLGFITDTTIGSEKLRARVMTAFEVVTVGGLAMAIPIGGQISQYMGVWGFLVVIGLHLLNTVLIFFLIKESYHRTKSDNHGSLFESLHLLKDKYMFTFLPSWLSVNTLVGAWITLITIMLAKKLPQADIQFPGQLLYGGFTPASATMALGGFGLIFLVGMGLWMLILPRIRRTTIMVWGLVGLALCVGSLFVVNGLGENINVISEANRNTMNILLGVTGFGILLLSGFTPAALTQMSAVSELRPEKRGAAMGLYSVVLGIGQLTGVLVGGLFVDWDGFYGLMWFSVILGVLSLVSVVYMRTHGHDLLQTGHKGLH